MTTMADLLVARAHDAWTGLADATTTWSWQEVFEAGMHRGTIAASLRRPGPFHIGVLLENVPEYLFWLGGAAMSGATVVGINPTRRGEALAADIRATDCQILVTDAEGAAMLEGLDHGVDPARVVRVDGADYPELVAQAAKEAADPRALMARGQVSEESLYLLLFTSGTTGTPKAVRCTQGRLATIGETAAPGYGYHRQDVCYCPMPLFHGNALMALWAPTLYVGATMALRPRFSASAFIDDVRAFGATTFSYVGKAIAYILATPERPDDAHNTLERAFGTEASLRDRQEFQRRFNCRLIEGYGQSEGGSAITVVPGTPSGALGKPVGGADLAVVHPQSGQECPRARFDEAGRLENGDQAIGEIVNRGGIGSFEGYYNNAQAQEDRTRNGWYWTGDLGYRDTEGYFYFAGRRGDWLRVDSENFAAGPVEAVLARYPDFALVAVYPVPDTTSGDQVMAAVELREGVEFKPEDFAKWLGAQPDLGTKWAPRYLRITHSLPQTATGKVTKPGLRTEAWHTTDPLWWRPGRQDAYVPLRPEDRDRLDHELASSGRQAP